MIWNPFVIFLGEKAAAAVCLIEDVTHIFSKVAITCFSIFFLLPGSLGLHYQTQMVLHPPQVSRDALQHRGAVAAYHCH